jgi:serine kinase of HPr protein (carbohydrate metabolism regulator)
MISHTADMHGRLFDMPRHLEPASELMHAAALIIGRMGILLRGPSGSGKSTLQRSLREEAALRSLYSALISDDYVRLARPPLREGAHTPPLMAFAPRATHNQQEVFGLGIVDAGLKGDGGNRQDAPSSAVIHLLVDLIPAGQMERMPSERSESIDCVGAPLAHLCVPQRSVTMSGDLVFAYLSTWPGSRKG